MIGMQYIFARKTFASQLVQKCFFYRLLIKYLTFFPAFNFGPKSIQKTAISRRKGELLSELRVFQTNMNGLDKLFFPCRGYEIVGNVSKENLKRLQCAGLNEFCSFSNVFWRAFYGFNPFIENQADPEYD